MSSTRSHGKERFTPFEFASTSDLPRRFNWWTVILSGDPSFRVMLVDLVLNFNRT